MDCVLRVIEGPDRELVYEPLPGETVIGKGNTAHMRLSAPEVSYEHAIVTRNADGYFVQNLSAMGTFVDETKVTSQVKLRPNSKIRLSSETVVQLQPAGDGAGLMAHRGLLWTLVLLMLGIIAVLMVWNPLSPPQRADDWDAAFNQITGWLGQEISARRIPEQTVPLFQEAWRLEQMKDWSHSYPAWLRLQLLLESLEDRQHLAARAAQHPRALQNLLTPPPEAREREPDPEQCSAAFVQFVSRRLAWSIKQNQLSKPGFKLVK